MTSRVISVMNTDESWVARWLDIDNFMPGCYCLKIYHDMSSDVIKYFKDQKIKYARNL